MSKPGKLGAGSRRSGRVQPHRRRAGDDPDRVVGPDRVPVVDALGVVPHAVAVDDVAAGALGDLEHAPVHVRRDAGDHRLRRRPEPRRPASSCGPARGCRRCRRTSRPRPAPAARTRPPPVRDDALPRSTSVGSSTVPRTPTAAPSSTISSSTWWRNSKRTRPRCSASSTGSRKTRTTSGPVPQVRWKRGTELPWPDASPAAALGPAHHRREAQSELVQVVALLGRREPDVRVAPTAAARCPRARGRSRPSRASPPGPARRSP